jgi:ABC-type lipoprotein release transport system permease subunit
MTKVKRLAIAILITLGQSIGANAAIFSLQELRAE